MNKNKNGITLIALVITVIVLLILAGAAVSIGLNGGDVFNRANQAKTEWNSKVAEENDALERYKSYLESDPNKIIINATQNGAVVQFSVNVPGNKSIEEATQDEKLQAILDVYKASGAPFVNEESTIQNVKNDLEIFTYEEEIEREIENYGITTSEKDTEATKLSNILEKWKEDDYYSEEKMIEDIEDVRQELQSREADNEDTINSELKNYGIISIGELVQITVKHGEESIEVLGDIFYPSEEGTYMIMASTQNGKYGETTITVHYEMVSLTIYDPDALIPEIFKEGSLTISFPENIKTWNELSGTDYEPFRIIAIGGKRAALGIDVNGKSYYISLNGSYTAVFNEIDLQGQYAVTNSIWLWNIWGQPFLLTANEKHGCCE